MKKILLLISIFIGFISCNKVIDITITNPSGFDRSEMIEVSTNELMPLTTGNAYIVKNKEGEIIPSQVTYDGKLIFQASIKSKETVPFSIKTGEPQQFETKTYGRFIKERKDDFAWENDKVAFRIYGQALIAIDGPSNGLDLWYKRTNNLIIDKWYKDDISGKRSYHQDHGEGLDDYKVGRSLGAGMMAPFENDSLTLNENFVSQEILENGPLRTTFKLSYKDITVNNKTFSETRTFSIDAGNQITKVKQEFGTQDTITVAAGIVKRNEDDNPVTTYTENGTAIVIYEEPEDSLAGKVFVGMIFPTGLERVVSNTYTITNAKTNKEEAHSHVLGVTSYCPGKPITYYTGYGWEKFGIPTLTDFQNNLNSFVKTIEEPLIIKIL